MEHEGTVEKAFTFVWKIENMIPTLIRPIHSPKFTAEELDKTEWHLELHPGRDFRDEYLVCRLQRDDSNEPESVNVNFEISLVLADGSLSKKHEPSKFSFCKGDFYFYDEFASRGSVFNDLNANFDIRCCIWACDEEYTGTVHCYARTRFAMKNRKFKWVIEDLSSLSVDPCRSFSLGEDEVTLKMFLRDGTYRVKGLKVEANCVDQKIVLQLGFRVCALDAKGKVTWKESYIFYILEDRSKYAWHWPLYITPKDLKIIYGLNSSNDVLTLQCQCSSYFIEISELEELPLSTN